MNLLTDHLHALSLALLQRRPEFKAMMLELGDPLTEAEIEEFFAAVDQDNDGRMSYEEFVGTGS